MHAAVGGWVGGRAGEQAGGQQWAYKRATWPVKQVGRAGGRAVVAEWYIQRRVCYSSVLPPGFVHDLIAVAWDNASDGG